MKKTFLSFFLLSCFSLNVCTANFEDNFKKCENKTDLPKVRNIDYIYLINLDKRTDRLEASLKELAPYGIRPYRFSAVYGKDLSPKALNEVGLQFHEGMEADRWVHSFSPDGNGSLEYDYLRQSCYGKSYIATWMRIGAVGCTLSHSSVLQDAYDSGYETIWVMEDDISVKKNPHEISELVDKLDALCGKEGWDVLYTDDDPPFPRETNLTQQLWWMWRPDNGISDYTPYAQRKKVSEDFVKIGTRWRTHSMIIRRAGIKKILDYEKKNHMFIPYDHEISLVPTIQLYMLRYPLVTWAESSSDIFVQQ